MRIFFIFYKKDPILEFPSVFWEDMVLLLEEISPSPSEENIVDERYHFMPLLLNLTSTFLYMVTIYNIVPRTDNYSLNLVNIHLILTSFILSIKIYDMTIMFLLLSSQ
ncbi:hypothetical protein MtrunA17_Chr7g0253831 [Medicago truncatula]|uniref:Transmembrane protein n=1 Tax=Medicago truncatula TaxID=3880 RepID=A0A396H8L2_MEDTR|nr:hypothetical protein MtrunA17_Chr7g0253831 [Medicago truncatula]